MSIPLGIRAMVRDGSRFDVDVDRDRQRHPSVPVRILLVVLLRRQLSNGPQLRGLVSDDWRSLRTIDKVTDYLWHMVLPIGAMVIGGFARLTLPTKNSFLEGRSAPAVRRDGAPRA